MNYRARGGGAFALQLLRSAPGLNVNSWRHSNSRMPYCRRNLLQFAVRGHCEEVLRHLIVERGADPGLSDKLSGDTPLHIAAHRGYTMVVAMLLSLGAEPDQVGYRGRTPCHNAAANGHAASVYLLLRAGADPQLEDSFGKSPARLAQAWDRLNAWLQPTDSARRAIRRAQRSQRPLLRGVQAQQHLAEELLAPSKEDQEWFDRVEEAKAMAGEGVAVGEHGESGAATAGAGSGAAAGGAGGGAGVSTVAGAPTAAVSTSAGGRSSHVA